MSDVAILHGNYFARGGGERVADAIAEIFDAPLYYGFGNKSAIPDDDIERRKLFHPNPLSKRLVGRVHQYRDALFMWYGSHLPELFDYDVVIQSGNEFGWYVPKQLDQTIVKYVHSPPRGPYDMHYKHGESAFHRAYSLLAKTMYRHTTSYVDTYIANSEVVAQRCQKAWNVEPEIVYPPVDVETYGSDMANKKQPNTFLTYSRLYRHKRTREIVQAFEDLDAQLIVGGKGPQREHLEEIAGGNVEIRGYLSETEKRELLASCDATIFNAENEDFGMVPIESFASGTPVLGVCDGFTQHQISDGENGLLYETGEPESIQSAIQRFQRDGVEWGPTKLEGFAQQFGADRFAQEMRNVVAQARKTTPVKCDRKQ